jgi:magnesium-transporting ATPase (P-type)
MDYISNELRGIDSLLQSLKTSHEHGILQDSMADRVRCYDSNMKEPPTRTPFYMLLYAALDDIMLKILMVCAIVSMVVDGYMHKEGGAPWYVEGVAIWLAIAVVSLVTAISDYQKEGEFLNK